MEEGTQSPRIVRRAMSADPIRCLTEESGWSCTWTSPPSLWDHCTIIGINSCHRRLEI